MLIQYKKDYEKTAMGLLSYLPDFKNIENLKEEISLNQEDNDFVLFCTVTSKIMLSVCWVHK